VLGLEYRDLGSQILQVVLEPVLAVMLAGHGKLGDDHGGQDPQREDHDQDFHQGEGADIPRCRDIPPDAELTQASPTINGHLADQ